MSDLGNGESVCMFFTPIHCRVNGIKI